MGREVTAVSVCRSVLCTHLLIQFELDTFISMYYNLYITKCVFCICLLYPVQNMCSKIKRYNLVAQVAPERVF